MVFSKACNQKLLYVTAMSRLLSMVTERPRQIPA